MILMNIYVLTLLILLPFIDWLYIALYFTLPIHVHFLIYAYFFSIYFLLHRNTWDKWYYKERIHDAFYDLTTMYTISTGHK